MRNIQCFQPGDKGQLLVGAASGLYLLQTATNEWSGPLKLDDSVNYDVTSIASVNGEYWLGTKNQGIIRLDRSLAISGKLMENLPPVLSMLPKPDGGVYVGTDGNGILELDDSGTVVRHFSNDVNLANSLPSDGVYDLLLDREGLMWVATYGGGLAKLNPYANAFLHLDHRPNDEQSIAHPFTRAILEDVSGLMWFGTKDGLSIWNRSNNSWRHLPLSAGEEEKAIVMSLAEDKDFVWAGTYNKGLFKISKTKLRAEPVTFLRGKDRRQGRIFSVQQGIPNGLWVGGINMDLYHLGGGGEVTTFPVSQVRDVFAKSEQEVWVAGRDGLARIRGAAAGAKVGFQEAMAANQETLDYSTLSFTRFSGKGILVGTTGAGLLFGDENGGLTGRLTEANGLPSNTVQSIAVESDRRLWVATSRGLARITHSPQDTTIDVYTQADGLATTEFNYGSAARLRDGSLLFGGPEGVTYFNPVDINTATTPPSVILEDLLLLNERQEPGGEVLVDHVNTLETLQLKHNQNALTLRFAGIAHAAGDKVVYRHQLKGLNKGWSLPSTSDQINYTNLEPGDYVFQVQAATSPDSWGPVKELAINISRPWYAQGVRFEQAYTNYPRCTPSRYALMTGTYPVNEDHGHLVGIPTERNFARQLDAAGYHSMFIGKWHLGYDNNSPKAFGFNDSYAAGHSGGVGQRFFPFNTKKNGKRHKEQVPDVEQDCKEGDYISDVMTSKTIDMLKAADKDKPFFAVLAFYAVHTPLEAKEADRIRNEKEIAAFDFGSTPEYIKEGAGRRKMRQDDPDYAGMVENVDENIGRLLAYLEASGQAENTIVVFSSDHGGLSNDGHKGERHLATSNLPLRAGKGWIYEGGIRIPLIMRWPAQLEPRVDKESIIMGMDVMPTLLDLTTDVQLPGIDGQSAEDVLMGKEKWDDRTVFWTSRKARPHSTGDAPMSAVRAGDFKLVHYDETDKTELFNLANDPGEETDLSAKETQVVALLSAKLAQWKAEYLVPEKMKLKRKDPK